MGVTSILLIQPREKCSNQSLNMSNSNPQGVDVAIQERESVQNVGKLAKIISVTAGEHLD